MGWGARWVIFAFSLSNDNFCVFSSSPSSPPPPPPPSPSPLYTIVDLTLPPSPPVSALATYNTKSYPNPNSSKSFVDAKVKAAVVKVDAKIAVDVELKTKGAAYFQGERWGTWLRVASLPGNPPFPPPPRYGCLRFCPFWP